MSDQAATIVPDAGGDDGDTVALDDHSPDVGGDEAGDTGDVILRGAALRGRQISPKTRELFAKAAAAMKGQVDADELVPSLGEEPEATGSGASPGGVAGNVVGGQPAAPVPPPVSSLVPDVVKQHEIANARQRQLDERETALTSRERELEPLVNVRESYIDSRSGAVKALLKQWGVAGTDDEVRAEVADLITELSHEVLGIQVDPNIKSRIDSRRANKKVDLYKSQAAAKEQALAKQQEEVRYNEWRRGSTASLKEALNQPAHASQFPYLAADDNGGDIVLDVIEAAHKKDGTVLHWTEAAKRANDYLSKNASDWFAKRKHLLTAAATPGAQAQQTTPSTQGDPSGIRRSRTLTNATAAAPQGTTPPPPQPGEAGFSMAAHRKATMAKFRSKVKPEE